MAKWITKPFVGCLTDKISSEAGSSRPRFLFSKTLRSGVRGVHQCRDSKGASLWILSTTHRLQADFIGRTPLASQDIMRAYTVFLHGGVLVSTLQVRQRRHAEDGSLAS